MPLSAGFEILEHTADVGVRARGRDLGELIAQAAAGMLSLLYHGGLPPAARTIEREVRAEAPDLLVHHALRELLYLLEDEALGPVAVEVVAAHEGTACLRVGVVPREQVVPLLAAPIKAVTRHALGITEEAGLLVTQIIFDV